MHPAPMRSDGNLFCDIAVSEEKPQPKVYGTTNCTKTDIDELYELLYVEDSIYSRGKSI